jgi:hypothetical protein
LSDKIPKALVPQDSQKIKVLIPIKKVTPEGILSLGIELPINSRIGKNLTLILPRVKKLIRVLSTSGQISVALMKGFIAFVHTNTNQCVCA